MKKIIFSLLIILLGYQLFFKDSPLLDKEISLNNYPLTDGNLVVINKQLKIQADPTNLVVIPTDLATNVTVGEKFLLQQPIIEPLQQMFTAAEEVGIQHFTINSAYRSGKLQQQLFEENGAELALPSGYSEHQSGLALDIGSTQGTMDQVEEGEWLAQHAMEYGFILRYPKDKIDVTGIAFEPWHFRYVGLPHSLIMAQKNFVLEEYIAFLQEKKMYKQKIDGVTYIVQYIEQDEKAKIPDTIHFEVSGDNEEGFIITSTIK